MKITLKLTILLASLVVVRSQGQDIKLEWDAPVQATNEVTSPVLVNGLPNTLTVSATITGYAIYHSAEVGTNYVKILSVAATATNATINGLSGPAHYFYIQATNSTAVSPPSNVVAPATNPNRPDKLRIPSKG